MTTSSPRYSEGLHILVDEPMRAAVLGLAAITAEQAGPHVRPREGETFRNLVETALDDIKDKAPELYADALKRGQPLLQKLQQRRKVS